MEVAWYGRSGCPVLISEGPSQLWRASPSFRLFVRNVHQLESVAIGQTWCERICGSICRRSGRRYVINGDFTLHWIELAVIATSSPLIRPIKPSLFIYFPPDTHANTLQQAGVSAHISSFSHLKRSRTQTVFFTGGSGSSPLGEQSSHIL